MYLQLYFKNQETLTFQSSDIIEIVSAQCLQNYIYITFKPLSNIDLEKEVENWLKSKLCVDAMIIHGELLVKLPTTQITNFVIYY